ncbi:MAG: hypothetical protein U9R60_15120 [Bacteroidota bacterium]|nr:hypothetical protein [Bacteroidota bacterium]
MIDLKTKIKKACQDQGINIQELAGSPGVSMSTSGLYAALANNSLKVTTLEAIAKELGIPVSSFFGGAGTSAGLDEKIGFMEEQLANKIKIMEMSDKMLKKNDYVINYLSEQVSRIKSRYKELQENFSNIDRIFDEDLSDGKKKTASEKKLKMLREEITELRTKINAILSE